MVEIGKLTYITTRATDPGSAKNTVKYVCAGKYPEKG
jgi:hypothetical protein